ncbi:hypothetical protein [Burkholderia vietnamiensis]|uniref:hypothetical protein n=1 Tax=Burkholderia vietnamiensis TaxID=60552 RepID=UPI001592E167|nr:hypothetical protein [Burkholderia vietnamiensis]
MNYLPSWTSAYLRGDRVGRAQAKMAYADYYCVDGSADDEPEIEERIELHRPSLVSYASRTGTRRNLAALRDAGWKLLVSATGVLRTEGFEYAIDNGAWTAFQQGKPFDEYAFLNVVEKLGEGADWIVLPDIVAGGLASLDYSLLWLERLRGMPTPLLIAVQDGMEIDDVRHLLSPAVGIFVGGTTEWKEATMGAWGAVARRRHCYLHVGRVNSARRIRICAAAGANSVDGTSASRFATTISKLDSAARQADMFAQSALSLADAQKANADAPLTSLIGGLA